MRLTFVLLKRLYTSSCRNISLLFNQKRQQIRMRFLYKTDSCSWKFIRWLASNTWEHLPFTLVSFRLADDANLDYLFRNNTSSSRSSKRSFAARYFDIFSSDVFFTSFPLSHTICLCGVALPRFSPSFDVIFIFSIPVLFLIRKETVLELFESFTASPINCSNILLVLFLIYTSLALLFFGCRYHYLCINVSEKFFYYF